MKKKKPAAASAREIAQKGCAEHHAENGGCHGYPGPMGFGCSGCSEQAAGIARRQTIQLMSVTGAGARIPVMEGYAKR